MVQLALAKNVLLALRAFAVQLGFHAASICGTAFA